MKAIHNVKTFSVIAALALTAAMPLASNAGGIVNDLSNTNNVAYDEAGNQYPVIDNGSEQSAVQSAQAQRSERIRLAGPTSAAARGQAVQEPQGNGSTNLFSWQPLENASPSWAD